MSDELLSLDDAYKSEQCKGSLFRAVKMMAEEARFINEQAHMGYIELNRKPTSIAMRKFKDHRLEMVDGSTPVSKDSEEIWE
jgi:hypothetical protein